VGRSQEIWIFKVADELGAWTWELGAGSWELGVGYCELLVKMIPRISFE
jgi:hypothetical protein